MKRLATFSAILGLLLTGCQRHPSLPLYDGSVPYRLVQTTKNFIPPPTNVYVWRFDASPGFDMSAPGQLTNHVNDALKQLKLPPVQSTPKNLGGFSEGIGNANFMWSDFEWTNYYGSNLTVRTGGWAVHRNTNRVIFVFWGPVEKVERGPWKL